MNPAFSAETFQHLPFSFASYTFHLTARETILLPEYKGSAFRGGFGHVMKKVCCFLPGKCGQSCQAPNQCAYGYTFETPQARAAEDRPIAAANLPHPFVILPPLTKRETIAAGEPLAFQLTLIGKAIEFLPYFIYVFDELGRAGIGRGRGKYQLDQVVTAAEAREVYSNATKKLTGIFATRTLMELCAEAAAWNAPTLALEFITPTRLTDQNQLTDKLPFDLLVRGLLRRASLLAKIHGETEWRLDYGAILEFARANVRLAGSALRWQDWERYSNRQQRRMKLGGFVGQVKYAGEFSPFLPLVFLGHYLHLGKNTTFGMGKYEILL